jgi:glyceraldehyde 3-phosphate dehydrogenase
MMATKVRVAVNGLGRIGRAFIRVAENRGDLEVVAVNDLGDLKNLAYLLRYDSVYGASPFAVSVGASDAAPALVCNGRTVRFFSERDPARLPWRDLAVDVVVEATGVFEDYAQANAHRVAGAKRVVITAPAKGEPPPGVSGGTVLMGVNDGVLAKCDISSNASCTTNAASPVVAILHEAIGIEKALLSTVHGYTATQALVDAPSAGDYRRGRAAAQNIVPSSTGAAIAVTQAFPALSGKFDGIALRVPVVVGSIADITFIAQRETSVAEVNEALSRAAREARWSRVFAVTDEPVVSSDILGSRFASIADLSLTRVVGGTLVKVFAWYDNEMGYAHALAEHVAASGAKISDTPREA